MGITRAAEVRFRETRFKTLTEPGAEIIEKVRNATLPSSDFNMDIGSPRISYRSYPVDLDGNDQPDISVGIQTHYTKPLEFKFLHLNDPRPAQNPAFVSVSVLRGKRICIDGKCDETLSTGPVYGGLRVAVGDFNGDGLTDFATVLMDKGLFLLFPKIREITAYLQEPNSKR